MVPDGDCLLSLVEFLYLDDVQQQDITHSLYVAALQCGLERLVMRCEAHYAHQLEVQLHSWPGGWLLRSILGLLKQCMLDAMSQIG